MMHLFVDSVHQYHVCQHPACLSNRAFERLAREMGGYELSRRIQKLHSYRLYDRKYPYDSATKAVELDKVNIQGLDGNYVEGIIAQEQVDQFTASLTPMQQTILKLLLEGYKPRDIAEKQNRANSNSIRWQKHQIKKRLGDYYAD